MTDEPDSANGHYKLRLFVTGSTPRSTRAIANMRKICEENLSGRYDLEVVDVYENSRRNAGVADHCHSHSRQDPT
jgi:circadian clock protein KaiB